MRRCSRPLPCVPEMTIRANFVRVTKHVFLAAVLAALGAGIGVASASAMTRETGCANLQTTIDEVAEEPNTAKAT